MKIEHRSFRLLGLALLLALVACATYPRDSNQLAYTVGWTLVGATNGVADLHDSGLLKGEDYETAKSILDGATKAYQVMRAAIRRGDLAEASAQERIIKSLLDKLPKLLPHGGG